MAKTVKESVDGKDPFAALNEKYGKGVIIPANSKGFDKVKEVTSTGSLTLDIATDIGGVPKGGKITHIIGGESSSKTTLSLHIIAEEQKKGNLCGFLDVEGTFCSEYAESIGVNLSRLYLISVETFLEKKKDTEVQAISGEEWLEILCDMLDTKQFGIIVLDSAAELCPMMELNGSLQNTTIGPMARMMSKALRTITAKLIPTNTGLVILNQYRMSPGKYGDPRVEATGEALKFYTALKIELSKSLDKDGDGVYGIQVKAKITKSKVGKPYGESLYYVEFGKGIQRLDEIIELAVEYKLIEKRAGGHYFQGETKLAHGADNLKQFFIDNEEFSTQMEIDVMSKLKNQ